jgi:signal transduction histidine kinase/HAMP domain-containing protein
VQRLSLQNRLLAALVVVGVVPILAFAFIGFVLAGNAVATRQSEDLAALTRLAASQVGGAPLDASTTGRLAALTDRTASFFGAGGLLLATSDRSVAIPAPPAGVGSGQAAETRSDEGIVTSYIALPSRAGILALSEPAGGLPELVAPFLASLAVALALALGLGLVLSRTLVAPLTRMTVTLDRLQAGDLSARLPVEGDDEVARLAASHNRLADALAARNRSLARVSHAVATLSPREGVTRLRTTAELAAAEAFGFTAVEVRLYGPEGPDAAELAAIAEPPERVPGEAFEVATPLTIGEDRVGRLVATQIPTREWGAADADLFHIFGVQLAAAVRTAELFGEVESLAELKAEFLRGVSHNLQTPLTSIRAFAGQLAEQAPDPRLDIIVEQADRLSRLVAQLLTVSKLEAGTLQPEIDVFPLGPLVMRVWESLGRGDHAFTVRDDAPGWLAAADRDWVEQIVWALLDNAIKYGGAGPVDVAITFVEAPAGQPVDGEAPALVTTVRDHGPGIAVDQRERVFERFARLQPAGGDGTGLGLSVARGLAEGTGGGLEVVDAADGAPGGVFALRLPAERILEV